MVGKLGGSTERARRLRGNATDVERAVWQHLQGRRPLGMKFRRQLPIGPYVADFGCLEAKLLMSSTAVSMRRIRESRSELHT